MNSSEPHKRIESDERGERLWRYAKAGIVFSFAAFSYFGLHPLGLSPIAGIGIVTFVAAVVLLDRPLIAFIGGAALIAASLILLVIAPALAVIEVVAIIVATGSILGSFVPIATKLFSAWFIRGRDVNIRIATKDGVHIQFRTRDLSQDDISKLVELFSDDSDEPTDTDTEALP